MARRKSNDLGPLNGMIDLAGALTMGLFARQKIINDFKKGEGEASAKAGMIVMGHGALHGGSRGIMSLGGLIGLNSGMKAIERQLVAERNSQIEAIEESFIDRVSDVPRKTVTPIRTNMWREYCEDGSAYGLNPYDYTNADDYQSALDLAKGVSVEGVEPFEETIAEKPSAAEEKLSDSKRYIWRKYCSDGTPYGINPEDYETADDYEDAIRDAKKN